VGGWSLGLKMAGIEVVAAYDSWDQANRTYERNLRVAPSNVDLRRSEPSDFPRGVDYVVGSPPCTRFSFSNRGGNGDLKDGLQDVKVFLEAVRDIRPHYWVMENVPRVAGILKDELAKGGSLREFSELVEVITVIDMSDYGLPQRRRRMLAGSFPLELLESYAGREVAPTLGEIIERLTTDPVRDPLFDFALEAGDLRGNEREPPLTEEEVRLNSQSKQAHRVYNRMAFPDPLDRTARTVTAVCTRVSRESIVIQDDGYGMRRLTLRERAVLQGFPVTFQFFGTSLTNQQKLIGNALPPLFAYYVGMCLRGRVARAVPPPRTRRMTHRFASVTPDSPPPRMKPKALPKARRFRAVIPNLGFGSGVRFELANQTADDNVSWHVLFYFGTPRDIREKPLDGALLTRSRQVLGNGRFPRRMESVFPWLAASLGGATPTSLQNAWTRSDDGVHPFQIADSLGEGAAKLRALAPRSGSERVALFVWDELERCSGPDGPRPAEKITDNAGWIYSGLVLGSWFNSVFPLR
jgi:DNA (cytosine-5)-methyltransferase 1